jgi:hypothetical protein
MPEDINNNVHRRDSTFPREKSVQEDLVPLGVERVVEGAQTGVNTIHFRGLVHWIRGHAVQATVCGFAAGCLLGSFLRRGRSMEAL